MEVSFNDIRWKQRFENFEKAFLQMEKWRQLVDPNIFEQQWIIQWFEFTFELAWKTMKDFLKSKWVSLAFPKDVILEWFEKWIIKNWNIWEEMLNERNKLSHIYDNRLAIKAVKKINSVYYKEIWDFLNYLKNNK